MSLKSLPIPPVPEEMARIAHAVFPHGNVFMQVRDTLGTIYTDETKARSVSNPWPARFCPMASGTSDGVPRIRLITPWEAQQMPSHGVYAGVPGSPSVARTPATAQRKPGREVRAKHQAEPPST